MPTGKSLERLDRYVVTPEGHYDIDHAPTCNCNPRLAGLLVVCETCGTVYGSVRESMDWGRGLGESKR